MDNISILTKSSADTQLHSNDSYSDLNILAKLKRLKIQENLLQQSLSKCTPTIYHNETDNVSVNYANISDFKRFAAKVKNAYNDVKTQFEDVKTNTDSQEALQHIDINDLKVNILELEEKIKSLKIYVQTKLTTLKQYEREITKHINDSPAEINRMKRHSKVQTATYNEIVPSPVRVIMNTPFKCLEIQQFHEFMSNSPNRYGGWNEYYHNIFVKSWKKYFNVDSACLMTNNEHNNMGSLNLFLDELLSKLQGIKKDDIILHYKWYSNYIYLKKQQQKAIDKWKSNKLMIKQSLQKAQKANKWGRKSLMTCNDVLNVCEAKNKKENSDSKKIGILTSSQENSGCQSRTTNYIQPTKQWIGRCNTADCTNHPQKNIMNLGQIPKLRTPNWRIDL